MSVASSSFFRSLLLAFSVAFASATALWAQEPRIGFPQLRIYTAEDVGQLGATWFITQASDGTLLVAHDGVSTFDGERWRTWSMSGAIGVRHLAPDARGRIWAAAANELGWFEPRGSELTYHSLRPKLPPEHSLLPDIGSVFLEGDHVVFVSDQKVLRWDGNSFRVWTFPGPERLRGLQAEGRIYLHHYSTGLHLLTGEGPVLAIPSAILGPVRVWWMKAAADGLRLLTSHGFAWLRDGVLTPDRSATSDLIKRGAPAYAAMTANGRLAIPTLHAGVILTDPSGTSHTVLDRREGLPGEVVNCAFVDRDDQLWIGSQSFLATSSLSPTTSVFDRRAGVADLPVANLIVQDNQVFGTVEDAVALNLATRRIDPLAQSSVAPIRELLVTHQGLLAAGFNGIQKIDPSRAETIRDVKSTVLALEASVTRANDYFFFQDQEIFRHTREGRDQLAVTKLPAPLSRFIEDRDGNIWVGTHHNLLVAPAAALPGAAAEPGPEWKLPAFNSPVFVTADRAGGVYAIARGSAWHKQPDATVFLPIAGFPAREIAAVSRAHVSDEVWLALSDRNAPGPVVGRIAIEGGTARWAPYDLPALSALSEVRSLAVESQADGKNILWISGAGGIVREVITPLAEPIVPRPPLLHAYALRAGDDAVRAIDAPLDFSTRAIRFELAAPEFFRRDLLGIETFLEGVDARWMPVGRESIRELSGLRDGRFTLRARVVANTGATSSVTDFTFVVRPPWWRSTPAMLGFTLSLLPLGYGVLRLRVRSLARRNAELEAKVRQRTEELEAANAAKTEFVANISHDIRNPLNGIVGLTLALDQTRLDQRQREIVSTLRECTGYLSTLVDDVLDFASIEAGRVELRPAAYMPGELLRSIITTVKTDAAESGATLTCEADPSLPTHLLGDAGRIQQILVNFVSNALKYAGGHIHLSVHAPADAPGEVEFAVADEGPGIPPAERPALFTKFTRLKRTRESNIPGSGLGLAACRLLADIMGGSVGVESEPGRGARFFLRLPLTLATAAPETAVAHLPNTTVLLVEDADYNAWAASAVLARLGLTCDRARDGAEALRLFSEKRYNIVLLDRNLPDMDGTDVARRIREMDAEGAHPLLLAVTAYCTAEDRAHCIASGMDAFVGKPLTPEKLRRVLLDAGRTLLAGATVDAPRDPAAPAYDFSLLSYLSDGSDEGLAGQLQRFADTLTATEQALAEAIESGAWDETIVQAHRIVGQARMIAAVTLADAALDLEAAARRADQPGVEDRSRRVTHEIEALTAAIRRHRRSMSTA